MNRISKVSDLVQLPSDREKKNNKQINNIVLGNGKSYGGKKKIKKAEGNGE